MGSLINDPIIINPSMTTFKTLSLFTIAILISASLQSFKSLQTIGVPQVSLCRDYYDLLDLKDDSYTKKWFVSTCTRVYTDNEGYFYTIRMSPFPFSEAYTQFTFSAPIPTEESKLLPVIDTLKDIKFEGEKSNPAWGDNVSEEGLVRTSFKTCELSLSKTDFKEFPYLNGYLVISCEQSQDNHNELHMIMVQRDYQSLKHKVVTKSDDGENFELVKHEYDFKTVEEQKKMFDYKDQSADFSACENALSKLPTEDKEIKNISEDSEVVKCETDEDGKLFKMTIQYRITEYNLNPDTNEKLFSRYDTKAYARGILEIEMESSEGQEPVYKLTKADYYYDEPYKYHDGEYSYIRDNVILDCIEPVRQLGREQLADLLSYKLQKCTVDESEGNLIAFLMLDENTCKKLTLKVDEEQKTTLENTEDDEDCTQTLGKVTIPEEHFDEEIYEEEENFDDE